MADLYSFTSVYKFPYPLAGDSVQNTYKRIEELAARIEDTYLILGIDLNASAALMQVGDAAGGDLTGTYPNPTIAADAVTTSKILDSAVTTNKINDSAVTTDKINDSAVTTDKLGVVALKDGSTAVTQAQSDGSTSIATTAYVDSYIAGTVPDGSISTAKLADGAVTNVKVAADADVAYSKLDLTSSIVNDDVSATAGIVDTKLDTISTAGKVANTATTATATSTNDTIVLRDSTGSFSAEEISLAGANFDILTPAGHGEGTLSWSIDDGSLVLGLEGGHVQLPIGQKQVVYAKNSTGVTISKMTTIMAVGAAGDRISIAPAVADGSVNAMYMLGVAAENIIDDSLGYVVTNGYVRNVNTSAWSVGTVLYFDPNTPGALTSTAPVAPDINLPVALVTKQNSSSGILYVRMKNGEYLDEIHDVKIDVLTLANGDILKYNGTLGVWENVASDDIEAHATTHELGGSDEVELDPAQITGTAVVDSDSRLTDARTPTSHASTHETGGADEIEIAPSQVTGTAVVDNDSRLTDARTPTTHASSHIPGGSDALDLTKIIAVGATLPTLPDSLYPAGALFGVGSVAPYLLYRSTGSAWDQIGGGGTPLTTKGDLLTRDASADVRLPVGATNGHVLTVDSAAATGMAWKVSSGMQLLASQTFTSSTTYAIPAGAKLIIVDIIGAGAGGASGGRGGTNIGASGGPGGAGGTFCRFTLIEGVEFTAGASTTVTIGAGGTGAPANTTAGTAAIAGNHGGETSFGSFVVAGARYNIGGATGYQPYNGNFVNSNSFLFGNGGITGSTVGSPGYRGFIGGGGGANGATVQSTNAVHAGGTGGISQSTSAAFNTTGTFGANTGGGGAGGAAGGGAGANGTSGAGGGGGGSATSTSANNGGNGGNGGAPGGGGGGGGGANGTRNGGAGGTGGNGQIKIKVYG